MDEATGPTCQHCRETFPLQRTGPRNPKYCSTRCRVAASHERRKADGRIVAEAKAKRERAAALRAPCANCSAPVPNRRAAYCMAPACRELAREALLARGRQRAKAAYDADPMAGRARVYAMRATWDEQQQTQASAKHRAWINARRIARTCVKCGAPFLAHPSRPNVEHCSIECRRVRPKELDRAPLSSLSEDHPDRAGTCRRCERPYVRDRRGQTVCHGCPGPARRLVAGWCLRCGTPFIQPCYDGADASRHCSDACRRRDRADRRRARHRAAFVAVVRRYQIHERDRWRCHLCGKKVNRDVVAPHPKAPTIDHVIPLAKGGTHEPANCRTAHFLCNSTKGSGGSGEQLMLIG